MKLAKLSLAAIVAAGALTTVNAKPLEETIKGVEFSGFLRYRLNQTETNSVKTDNYNDWDFNAKFTAPVTENIKAVMSFSSSSTNGINQDGPAASANSKMDVDLRRMFFVYKQDALTVQAGQMAIAHPIWYNGFNGSTGNGVLAMYNAGPVTFAGAYFAGSNEKVDNVLGGFDIGNTDVATVAAIGSMGPVNAQVWVATLQDVVDTQVFAQVDASVEMVSVTAQYINTKVNDRVKAAASLADDSGNFFALKADVNLGPVTLTAGMTDNDKDQPVYAVDVDDSQVITSSWNLDGEVGNTKDAEQYFGQISGKIGAFGLMVGYADAENLTYEFDEVQAKVDYAVSKNFTTYVRYAAVGKQAKAGGADEDYDVFRFEAKYSF